MTIRGLIFDYGGVLWDMRWDLARTLEQEHGLRERTIIETLYGSETWQKLEIGVGDRQAWLDESHLALEAAAGRELPRLHQHWRERQHLIAPNIDLIRRLRSTLQDRRAEQRRQHAGRHVARCSRHPRPVR